MSSIAAYDKVDLGMAMERVPGYKQQQQQHKTRIRVNRNRNRLESEHRSSCLHLTGLDAGNTGRTHWTQLAHSYLLIARTGSLYI